MDISREEQANSIVAELARWTTPPKLTVEFVLCVGFDQHEIKAHIIRLLEVFEELGEVESVTHMKI